MAEDQRPVLEDKHNEAIRAGLAVVAKNNNMNQKAKMYMQFGVIVALEGMGIQIPPVWYIMTMAGREIFTVEKPKKEKRA